MYDHDYYAKMDKAMVRVLKAVARSVGYGFTGLYHYLKKQPTRLTSISVTRSNWNAMISVKRKFASRI